MTTRYHPADIAFARATLKRHNSDRHFRLPAEDLAALRKAAEALPGESRATPTELDAVAAIRARLDPAPAHQEAA